MAPALNAAKAQAGQLWAKTAIRRKMVRFGMFYKVALRPLGRVKKSSLTGWSRPLWLFDNLPLLAEDLVDDLDEFLAVEVLQRIEVPASLVRNLVSRSAFFRHSSSHPERLCLHPLAHYPEHPNLVQVPDISAANPVPSRQVIPVTKWLNYVIVY
jgi:hypothetical protein